MSDSYEINGVTVTPMDGGYYALSHPSLPEPLKVRGKEKAEARALDLAAGTVTEEGDEPLGQPDLSALAAAVPTSDSAEVLALRARVAELEAAKTVTTSAGEVPQQGLPPGVPNRYTGPLDDKTREGLAKVGITTTRIILEESPDIPPTGLFVGHNGRGYMIVPGEPVDVPDFILAVLDDAMMSSPMVDGKTQKVLGYRQRSKYPYRRVE
jgi:hypothetical protein